MSNKRLFIFAHQDDELGVFPEIVRCLESEIDVIIAYLTTGTFDGTVSTRRCNESIKVLSKLGVNVKNIHFLGNDYVIPDAQLSKNLFKAFDALVKLISKIGPIEHIYTLAWEAGHADHDASHPVSIALAYKLNLIEHCQQFSLYSNINNGKGRRSLCPNPINGSISSYKISLTKRTKFAWLLWFYPSQIMISGGLFFAVTLYYLFIGKQQLQPVSITRIFSRPHTGELMSKRFKKNGYLSFQEDIKKFLNMQNFNLSHS
jgi:hypothetical protein